MPNTATATAPRPRIVSGLPRNLAAVAAEIHQDNINAGWWKIEPGTGNTLPRNIGEMLALVHSEISEADYGAMSGAMDDKLPHRCMVEVELADVAIRVLDILGYYQCDMTAAPDRSDSTLTAGQEWHGWALKMHRMTTAALEGFRKGDVKSGCFHLVVLLWVLHHASLWFRYDLTGAIAEKRAFNAQRLDHKREHREAVGGKQF